MTAVREEKLSTLEIILKENGQEIKNIICAFKLDTNGKWKYQRSNRQVLKKQSSVNPKQHAYRIRKLYNKQGKTGKISWEYLA